MGQNKGREIRRLYRRPNKLAGWIPWIGKTMSVVIRHLRFSNYHWGIGGLLFFSLFLLFAPVLHAADTEFFDRQELYIDGPIEDLLIGDADGDGLLDIFIFYRPSAGAPGRYRVAFFKQDRRDHFRNTLKQSWDLPVGGGFFDLADVAGDATRELVMQNNRGIFYYALQSQRFGSLSEPLISPNSPSYLPPLGVRSWDFCWPLLAATKEVIAVPSADRVALWQAGAPDGYYLSDSLMCPLIIHPPFSPHYRPENMAGGVAGINYCLPTPATRLTSASSDIFLCSPAGVKSFRRDSLAGLGFHEGLFLENHSEEVPFFTRGPFGGGVWVDDLNGDGSADLLRWRGSGGITQARTDLEVYFGPLSGRQPITPHQQISLDNVAAYPLLADLDGDGRQDIVLCAVELGTVTSAKMIVVHNVNVFLLAYRQRPDNSFGTDPEERLKLSCQLNTKSGDLLDRVPVRFAGDFNADGLPDFVTCPGGDELHVYLGREGRLLPKEETLNIDCDSPAAVYPVDLDHDRRTDLVVLHHTKPHHVHKVTVLLTR